MWIFHTDTHVFYFLEEKKSDMAKLLKIASKIRNLNPAFEATNIIFLVFNRHTLL